MFAILADLREMELNELAMITILKKLYLGILCVCILVAPQRTFAQDDNVSVPNVVGLSLPQAAALLNASGLNLGSKPKSCGALTPGRQ